MRFEDFWEVAVLMAVLADKIAIGQLFERLVQRHRLLTLIVTQTLHSQLLSRDRLAHIPEEAAEIATEVASGAL